MASFLEQIRSEAAKAEKIATKSPYHDRIERFVSGQDMISTAAIQTHLGIGRNQHTAREIAPVMRELGYHPIQSARFLPGGHKSTIMRGWCKPCKVTRSTEVPALPGDVTDR